MKRRVKTQQPGFYSNEPAVATKQMTAKPPVPSTALASKAPKQVPKSPGKMSGVAGFAQAKAPKGAKFPPAKAIKPPTPKTKLAPPKAFKPFKPPAVKKVKGV